MTGMNIYIPYGPPESFEQVYWESQIISFRFVYISNEKKASVPLQKTSKQSSPSYNYSNFIYREQKLVRIYLTEHLKTSIPSHDRR